MSDIPTVLRFANLKVNGIIKNWPDLKHKVENEDFPPGRKLSPNMRVWTPEEVSKWIEDRPTWVTKKVRITENHVSVTRKRKDRRADLVEA